MSTNLATIDPTDAFEATELIALAATLVASTMEQR